MLKACFILRMTANNRKEGNKPFKIEKPFTIIGSCNSHLSIDESMILYCSWQGANMFIKENPTRFAYKVHGLWCSDNVLYDISIHQEIENEKKHPTEIHCSLVIKRDITSDHSLSFVKLVNSYNLLSQLCA